MDSMLRLVLMMSLAVLQLVDNCWTSTRTPRSTTD